MHEFSLAQEIAERLKAEAEREGARRIVAVDIEVGGLVHGSADNIAFWVKEALRGRPGKGRHRPRREGPRLTVLRRLPGAVLRSSHRTTMSWMPTTCWRAAPTAAPPACRSRAIRAA